MDIIHIALGAIIVAGFFFHFRSHNPSSSKKAQQNLPTRINVVETGGSLKRERERAAYDLLYHYACAVENYNAANADSDLQAYDDIDIFKQFIPTFEPLFKKYPRMIVLGDSIVFDIPTDGFVIEKTGDIRDLYSSLNSKFGLGYNYDYDYIYAARSREY